MPKSISGLDRYVLKVTQLKNQNEGQFYFRGHPNKDYLQIPSAFRNIGHRENESSMLYGIMASAPTAFDSDRLTFDRLVRAQHYGIKTRLLDISTNALIGLYFACEDQSDERGQVIVYRTEQDNIKYFQSDAVSCKSNMAQLKNEEKLELFDDLIQAWRKAKSDFKLRTGLRTMRSKSPLAYASMIENFNKSAMCERLVQFIREEKPYFKNAIDPIDLLTVDVVEPKRNNPRISAQSGAFLLFGFEREDNANAFSKISRHYIDIDGKYKRKILDSLESIGIHEQFVYPELDKAANRISRQFRSKS